MDPSQDIEREFGVPIPGTILAPEFWSKTALKKLPPPGPIDWQTVFGRRAPLVVDLGCGNGRFLLGSAHARLDFDHVGIDILPMVLRYATRRGNQRGLQNLRFAAIDGERFVAQYLGDASAREIHCYHPQPFHDRRQMARRLITPTFCAQLVRVLEPGGTFFVQTDNRPYWKYMCEVLPTFFDFAERSEPWDDAPRGRTRREIVAQRKRLKVYRGTGSVRPMTFAEANKLAAKLSLPTFDAGPRRHDVDAMENEGRET